RAPTQTPSYMNAAVAPQHQLPPTHAPSRSIPRVPVDANTASSPVSKGLLILAIAGPPAKELRTYVEGLLSRSPAAEVAILGLTRHESSLKQLKMDMYGLAGKLSLELAVQLCLREGWTAGVLEDAIHEALGRRKGSAPASPTNGSVAANGIPKEIKGIICCPQVDHGSDLLGVETHDLASSWQSSVGFLHAAARGSIPWMATRAQGVASKSRLQGPFLFTTNALAIPGAVAQSIHRPSMRALLDSLDRFYGPSGITFGHAEHELKYEPELETVQRPSTNGTGKLSVDTHAYGDRYADEDVGDSPTKLWGMWA
ncbi:hypothetical protein K431DRAFT_206248, partial [Polychaeton citri CBS 116435]